MSHWNEAVQELAKFNALYAQAQKKGDLVTLQKAASGTKRLLKLSIWARKFLTKDTYNDLLVASRQIAKVSKDASEDELRAALDQYKNAAQKAIDSAAPDRFTYEGFHVSNPERFADELVRRALSGLDVLKALFKKRGISDTLFKQSISKIALTEDSDVGTANFNSSDRVLTISVPELIKHPSGRFLDTMQGETLLHEFGHYIHLNYIKGEAAAAWDSDWEGIADLADPNNRSLRNDPKRKQRLDELEVVTEYGRTNEREDFAETFMLFIAAPERLSLTAKFRMERALSLSGLYGKPVLRLAHRVAARFNKVQERIRSRR